MKQKLKIIYWTFWVIHIIFIFLYLVAPNYLRFHIKDYITMAMVATGWVWLGLLYQSAEDLWHRMGKMSIAFSLFLASLFLYCGYLVIQYLNLGTPSYEVLYSDADYEVVAGLAMKDGTALCKRDGIRYKILVEEAAQDAMNSPRTFERRDRDKAMVVYYEASYFDQPNDLFPVCDVLEMNDRVERNDAQLQTMKNRIRCELIRQTKPLVIQGTVEGSNRIFYYSTRERRLEVFKTDGDNFRKVKSVKGYLSVADNQLLVNSIKRAIPFERNAKKQENPFENEDLKYKVSINMYDYPFKSLNSQEIPASLITLFKTISQ